MNLKKQKITLILIGLFPFIFTIIKLIVTNDLADILEHLPFLNIIIGIQVEKNETERLKIAIETITQIIGLILIIKGILINSGSIKPIERTNKIYKFLKIIGYTLLIISFIIVLSLIFLSIKYLPFHQTSSLFSANMGELLLIILIWCSLSFFWIIPIIGIILIIKSNQKLRQIESCDKNE